MRYRLNNPLLAKSRGSISQKKGVQLVIFTMFTLLMLLYGYMHTYSMSRVHYAIVKNAEIVAKDTSLEEVSDYTVSEAGSEINLMSGNTIVPSGDITFAFYENKGTEEVFYDRQEQVLLVELDADYAFTFLKESSYPVVITAVVATLVLLYLLRNKEWVVLSTRSARVIWWGITVGMILVGALTVLML